MSFQEQQKMIDYLQDSLSKQSQQMAVQQKNLQQMKNYVQQGMQVNPADIESQQKALEELSKLMEKTKAQLEQAKVQQN